MKITISKTELFNALDTVIKATSSRSSVPALSGILISTEADKITFFATDLETSIKTNTIGIIDEPGSVAVPAKIFTDIIRSLPESSVVLTSDDSSIQIECNQSHFNLRTTNAAEFTRFPEITGTQKVKIPSKMLSEMVKKASKAVSRNEVNAILTGVNLEIEGDVITMASVSNYRLALAEGKLDEAISEPFSVIVPGKAFVEVSKMAHINDDVEIIVSSNQIKFNFSETSFITRRIEGRFPDYRQIIPKEWNIRATLDRAEFSEAVKRNSIFTVNDSVLKLDFSMDDQTIKISSNMKEIGASNEDVMCKIEGGDGFIFINHSYLQEGLSVVSSETITLEILNEKKPAVLRADEENFIFLMMPLNPR